MQSASPSGSTDRASVHQSKSILCWKASHRAVILFASAFPLDEGAWASLLPREGNLSLRLLQSYQPPEFMLQRSLGCWGELGSMG